MVSKTTVDGLDAYRCDECQLRYPDKDIAEDCEMFCRENNQCSREITKNALVRQSN